VRFLVDAQLPPALARRLEALGHRTELPGGAAPITLIQNWQAGN
jgi:hypothetical protein